MYNEILTILLKSDPPKTTDSSFKHPFASLPIGTKRDVAIAFYKKYPWTVDEEFAQKHKFEIISPKICPKIEGYMNQRSWQLLHNELNTPLPADKYYPVNYWERLAFMYANDPNATPLFIDLMFKHGFKFTEGVVLKLVNNISQSLEPHTKQIILTRIKLDKERMMLELTI